VDNTRGDTNVDAEGVRTTFTSAPALIQRRTKIGILYAAILPDAAMSIFFPVIVHKDAMWR